VRKRGVELRIKEKDQQKVRDTVFLEYKKVNRREL